MKALTMGRCSFSKSCGAAVAGGDAAGGDLAGGDAAGGDADDPSAMITTVGRAWSYQLLVRCWRIKEL